MPGSRLHVRSRHTWIGGFRIAVVQVSGDVDADGVQVLRAALLHALGRDAVVRCDLSGVGFFGAAGANTLAAAGLQAVEAGRRLELCGVHGVTRRVLVIAGLDRVLPIVE
ncbi:STAS domain-containing protein [Actinoplanes italicus]|uniref:Anti-anti-sigma factor n=1 Tax=Actinoplanes italicus TaxID=113567 RepID=A0A2T0JYM0_9ACTN|nr:STAS domain-containing protein [Actinoplanes italicus]PRX13937.1 anti-anti-sigma factor [Actinoplanes italicus]